MSYQNDHKLSATFAKETTVHGVSYALNKNAPTSERWIWVFIIIAAMAASLLLTANLWLGYIQGDLGTKNIPVNPRDLEFMEKEFPIMYCPSNWINPIRVAQLMEQYDVTFEGIDYGLSLIPRDDESLFFLRDQLLLMKTKGMEYNDTVAVEQFTDLYYESKKNKEKAVAEFAKLPHANLWELIEDIAVQFEFENTILRDKSLRYGRLCLELQASDNETLNEGIVTAVSYTVVHPQPMIVGHLISVHISPVVGNLDFSAEAVTNLDRAVGFNEMSGDLSIPYTSLFNYAEQLAEATEQLSIKAFSYQYSTQCEHTQFSGVHGAELPRLYCEQVCLKETMLEQASRYNCSMADDWKSWRDGQSTMPPCHLNSRWFKNTRSKAKLNKECAKNCSITECTDYYRKVERYGELIEENTPSTFWTDLKERVNNRTEAAGGFWLEDVDKIMWQNWYSYDYNDDVTYGDWYYYYFYYDYPEQRTWVDNDEFCANIKGDHAIFQSANFPDNYPEKIICYYRFEAPAGRSVNVVVQTASLEQNRDSLICFDGDDVNEKKRIGLLTGCTHDHSFCPFAGKFISPHEQMWFAASNVVLCVFVSDVIETTAGFSLLLQSVDPTAPDNQSFWIEELMQPWSNGSFTFKHTIELNILQLQKAMEYEIVGWMDLLAGVGGVFSLFIGSSMLSIVHLFWFWFKSVCTVKKHQKKADSFNQTAAPPQQAAAAAAPTQQAVAAPKGRKTRRVV